MGDAQTFEEWQRATAPSPEQAALARSLPPGYYLLMLVLVALGAAAPHRLAFLVFLALWFPTGVLKRRWLRSGVLLSEVRFRILAWVRLAIPAAVSLPTALATWIGLTIWSGALVVGVSLRPVPAGRAHERWMAKAPVGQAELAFSARVGV